MDFAKLKAAKKGNNSYADLAKKAEEAAGGGYEKDPRYLVPKVDSEGNGLVIMRFLPHAEADGEDYADYVTLYKHAFKTDAGWYIENSRTTLPDPDSKYGQKDPVSEANRKLFSEMGKDAAIEFLRAAKRNRQTKLIANVLVLKNDAEPETVGKVMLYEYGTKILDKILAKTKKDLEDDIVFDAFNMWEGANFRLKMKKLDGNRNYDDSYFDQPAPLYGGDDSRLEVVFGQLHSLSAEIAPEKFKSYADLEKRFLLVTGGIKQETAESSNAAPKQDAPAQSVPAHTSGEPKQQAAASTPAPAADKPKSAYFEDADDSDIPF